MYSDVFIIADRVYKLFKRSDDPNLHNHALSKFGAQCDAYMRVASDIIMRKHTAQYYGVCHIERVVNECGGDVEVPYCLDACYVVERLFGPELKVTDTKVLTDCPYIFELRRYFREMGINTTDSTVFNYNDPERFKLIDFDKMVF